MKVNTAYFKNLFMFRVCLIFFIVSTSAEEEQPEPKYGASPRTYSSAEKATMWLETVQNKDGSWGKENKRILSSYIMLTFAAQGESPNSKRYGERVKKLISWLSGEAEKMIIEQKAGIEGAHILMALNEAAYLSGVPGLIPLCRKLNVILQGEFSGGHWPSTKNELIFNLICMRSQLYSVAAKTASEENRKNLVQSIKWIKKNSKENPMINCYVSAYIRTHADKLLAEQLKEMKSQKKPSYFKMFLASKSTFWKGGKVWGGWRRFCNDNLSERQKEDGRFPEDSSGPFKMPKEDLEIYNTSMALLSLTVYYRYLPTFVPDIRANSDTDLKLEE